MIVSAQRGESRIFKVEIRNLSSELTDPVSKRVEAPSFVDYSWMRNSTGIYYLTTHIGSNASERFDVDVYVTISHLNLSINDRSTISYLIRE